MADNQHEHICSGEPVPAQEMRTWLGSRESRLILRCGGRPLRFSCFPASLRGLPWVPQNGLLCHYIVGAFGSPLAAGVWGTGLGVAGGILVVVLRRAIWGPDISVEIGTLLGLIYGIAPGLAVLFQSLIVNRVLRVWGLAGLVFAGSMAGLIIGGVLDRFTEAIIVRMKQSRAKPTANEAGRAVP